MNPEWSHAEQATMDAAIRLVQCVSNLSGQPSYPSRQMVKLWLDRAYEQLSDDPLYKNKYKNKRPGRSKSGEKRRA